MAVNLSPVGGVAAQFFDNSGNVLTGGLLYSYLAGTTTPAVTYTSNSGLAPNSNPIVLDAAGRVPSSGEIWLTDGISYKFILQDQNAVQIATWDNIVGINSNFIAFTGQSETQTATQGQTIFTLTTIQYQPATNNLSIFVNGSKQILSVNYQETSPTVVTFIDGLNVGDVVEFSTAEAISTTVSSADDISYVEGGTGSVYRTVTSKLQEFISIKDFGATGDGVTDDTASIQKAINAIVTSGHPSMLYFPAGTYKCLSGITIDVGYVSCFGEKAILDFSYVGDIVCITFTTTLGSSGNPYYNRDSVFSGMRIVGPGTSAATGMYFNTLNVGNNLGPAQFNLSSINMLNFKHGVRIGNHSYCIKFTQSNIGGCAIAYYSPTTDIAGNAIVDSGELLGFDTGTLYNSTIGFQNDNSNADFSFVNTSFDYCSNLLVKITAGQAAFLGCHLETSALAIETTTNSITTFSGCLFINNTSNNKFINLDGFSTFNGGRIAANATSTNLVYGTVNSRVTMIGLHVQGLTLVASSVFNGVYYYQNPNTSEIYTNNLISTKSRVDAQFFFSSNLVSITTLNTWTNMGIGAKAVLVPMRDTTSGGTALFMADTFAGATSIQNGITGLQMQWNGTVSDYQLKVTSGTVTRNIYFGFMQVS